jgi:hypothetical protein
MGCRIKYLVTMIASGRSCMEFFAGDGLMAAVIDCGRSLWSRHSEGCSTGCSNS